MKATRHCDICDHQIFEVKTGIRCGLTDERPDFKRKCQNIKFDTRYEAKIKEVNIDFESIKRVKVSSYVSFFTFLTISLVIISGGYLLGKYALEKGVISTVPLIIMGVGFLVLPKAFGSLNFYRRKMAIAKEKKNQLDDLLAIYGIEYAIEIDFNTDIHGNDHPEVDLVFLRKHYR